MAHTYALGRARTTATGNPITFSYTVATGDTVICLLLNVGSGTNRAGGAPTWGSRTFIQRDTTRKATASPERSAELWDVLNPLPGTYTLTIPNTASLSIHHTVVIGRAAGGGYSAFNVASGGNGTSTNPTPGAAIVTDSGDIGVAVVASGAASFNASAMVGTSITNGPDGGEQYILNPAIGAHTLSWTFSNSDDWGAVSAYYKEIPPRKFNNYQSVRAADGISVGERIR